MNSAVYDRRLADLGWTVLRFWNDDVLRESGNVCQHVVIAAGLAEPETAILCAATPATERPRP